MERKINIENIVSMISFTDYDTMNHIVNIILQIEDNFFFIEDEYDKVVDVSQMPDYIKTDWFIYNKKELNLSSINKHVMSLTKSLENLKSIQEEEKIEQNLEKLKSIRREFIIKGIL